MPIFRVLKILIHLNSALVYICLMINKLLYYLNPFTLFAKRDEKESFNLRFMHGINRISVFMFIIGLVILFIKYVL